MSKTVKNKLIPQLRFPEFQNAGEWEVKNGNELFEEIKNKNHNSDLPILAITQEYGAIPRDKINYKISVTEKSIKNYKVVEKGDFIISLRSFQGGIEYSEYKGLCSPAYIILRKKNEEVYNYFFKHYFKTFRFIQLMNRNLEGIRDGKIISYKQFSALPIPVPSLPEQKKIADFLSSADRVIELTEKKLQLLRQYKKGLLQRLFPAEGQTVPALRFPQFRNDPPWEVKKLGEVAEEYSSSLTTKSLKTNKGNYNLYGASGIIQKIDFYTEEEPYIAMIKDGSGVGKIFFCEAKSSVIGTLKVIKAKKGIEIKFLYYYLSQINFSKYVIGGAIPHLYFKDYSNEKVPVPSLQEQKKIADFLTSLDNIIEATERKLELLKEYKKGLLQRVFPKW